MSLGLRGELSFACALVALSLVGTLICFQWGTAWLLPGVAAAPAYLAMVRLLKDHRRGAAIGVMLVWAALLGGTMTLLCWAWPQRASEVVIHGPAYWEEMRGWLETGSGAESTPAKFLPQHAMHAALFIVLSLATGSALSILLGAVMMGYMSYYVAHVMAASQAHPVLSALLGWHPWSILRVCAFIVLGVVLAEPLLGRLRSRQGIALPGRWRSAWRPGAARWIVLALALLMADIAFKTALAPHWAPLLRSLR